MLERDYGPIDESAHFLSNNFNPGLDQGELRSHTIDGRFSSSDVIQVCLMEHVWVTTKAEKMSCVGNALKIEE